MSIYTNNKYVSFKTINFKIVSELFKLHFTDWPSPKGMYLFEYVSMYNSPINFNFNLNEIATIIVDKWCYLIYKVLWINQRHSKIIWASLIFILFMFQLVIFILLFFLSFLTFKFDFAWVIFKINVTFFKSF